MIYARQGGDRGWYHTRFAVRVIIEWQVSETRAESRVIGKRIRDGIRVKRIWRNAATRSLIVENYRIMRHSR